MHFKDLPYNWKYGHFGIIVRPTEVDIFRQFIEHHQIPHGYTNLMATLNRIRNAGNSVIFYMKSPRTLKYYNAWAKMPHWMQTRPLCDMYENVIEHTDILQLLA